jgi:hypothetical protein
MKKVLVVLLLAGVLGIVGYLYADSVIGKYRDQAMAADSIAAAADTARLLVLASLDSATNAYQRRIVQTELTLDSISRELRLRPVVEIPGELRIDTLFLTDTVYAQPEVEEGRQDYEYDGEDLPFAYHGTASIWPAEYRGVFNVRIYPREPIPVTTMISCGQETGVRSAHVTMLADDPFSLVPGQVRADPDVCNPFRPPIFTLSKGKGIWAGIGFLLGLGTAHLLDDGFRKARY